MELSRTLFAILVALCNQGRAVNILMHVERHSGSGSLVEAELRVDCQGGMLTCCRSHRSRLGAHAEDSERGRCEAARSTGIAKRIATTGDGEAPPPKFAKYTVEQIMDVPCSQVREDIVEVIQLTPQGHFF